MRYSSVRVGEIVFTNEYFLGQKSGAERYDEVNDSHEAVSVDHFWIRVDVTSIIYRRVRLCNTEC